MPDFNPNLQSDLRSEKAQGANVGDIRSGYRWDGVNWTAEQGGGGGSSGGGGFEDTIRRSIAMAQEANQPAIQTMQGQVNPLKDRYTKLLDSIKGEQKVATDKQTVITSNELGKRGLLPASTLAQQEVQNSLQPVNAQYNSLYANTGIAQEKDLGSIASAIAQLQAGGASQGLTLGSNYYGAQQTAQQNAAQNAIAQGQLANQTKQTEYNINAPYFKPESGTGTGITSLFKSLGGLGGVAEPKPTAPPNQINNSSYSNPYMTPKPTSSFKPISSSGRGYAGYA